MATAFVAGMFMDIMDTTIVNVALPTLGRNFGVGDGAFEWVVTGYLLGLAGWIGDRFGTKKTFLFALLVFTAGAALCGAAWDIQSTDCVPRSSGSGRRHADAGGHHHAVSHLRVAVLARTH